MREMAELFIIHMEWSRQMALWELRTHDREPGQRLNRLIASTTPAVIRNGDWACDREEAPPVRGKRERTRR